MELRHTQRLFINASLNSGAALTLKDEQAHYLQNVLRMKTGDALRLFNGKNGEWLGEISAIAKRSVEIKIQKQTREQKPEPDLWLCCAPIKKAHFDYMIEKATELGVSEIRPLLTSRTQIREVNVERCTAMAVESAEQSDRLGIPQIQKPETLDKLVSNWPADRKLVVCAEWGDALPVEKAFQSENLKSVTKAAIVTGPEGGFSTEELEKLKAVPHSLFIRLGPRILRADTAAIAALSCWQAMRGDWTQT